MSPEHFKTLARYNRWANVRLYRACRELPEEAYHDKRAAAFFGSIHGTLNHILLADRIWLDRVEDKTSPEIVALDQILSRDFTSLAAARAEQDTRIAAVVDALDETRLGTVLSYTNMAGEASRTRLDMVMTHLFNHQAHHRGQAHALVLEGGGDPPPLDLIYFLRETEGG